MQRDIVKAITRSEPSVRRETKKGAVYILHNVYVIYVIYIYIYVYMYIYMCVYVCVCMYGMCMRMFVSVL